MTYKILFSPVGTTDPVTEDKINNPGKYYDGSIVQLIKKLKPNEVYLYFSKTLQKRENDTHQVTNYLKTLRTENNIPFELASNLEENIQISQPQLFDAFYEDFQKKIIAVINHCSKDKDDQVKMYLNISSGTPAMKSTLFLLANTLSYPHSEITAYQVYTPNNVNNKTYLKYLEIPSKELYNNNIDNDNNDVIEKRTHEAKATNLNNVLLHNQVKKFIEKYNYSAATTLIEQDKNINQQAKDLIDFGKNIRELKIDEIKYQHLIQKYHYDQNFIISNDIVKNNMPLPLYEYLLNLNVLAQNKDITNFIRALSPALIELFIKAINKYFNKEIHIQKFTNTNKQEYIPEQNLNNKVITKLNQLEKYPNNKNQYQLNTTLCLGIFAALYENKNKDQRMVYTLLRFLRLIEYSVRNLVAHNIAPLTEQEISERVHDTVQESINNKDPFKKEMFSPNLGLPNSININFIMKSITILCKLLYGSASAKMWNKFDDLNKEIINHIDR